MKTNGAQFRLWCSTWSGSKKSSSCGDRVWRCSYLDRLRGLRRSGLMEMADGTTRDVSDDEVEFEVVDGMGVWMV